MNFNKFAEKVSSFVSKAPFFVGCVCLVLIWSPTIFFMDFNTSQLLINTPTTIITFLLVAVLQNSTRRFETATNRKLNAMAEAIADILEEFDNTDSDITELRQTVGLEKVE